MISEYLSIGYIRTNCLSKVAHLIDKMPKTKFSIARSQQEKRKVDSKYRWLNFMIIGTGSFNITWDIWRDKIPFQTVLNELSKFQAKHHFEDFVVNRIEVGIDDPSLVKMVNKTLEVNNIKDFYESKTRFYVTFSNNPLAYDAINGWDAKIITDINLNAIINQKFKRGTLDITHIESDRRKKKSQQENINFVVHEKEIAKQILSYLDTVRWYSFPEVNESINPDTGKRPKPGAIRTYERKSTSKWSFVSDEEV